MEETCTKIRRAIGEVTFAKLIPIENRAVNHEDARTIYSNRVKLSTKFLSRKSALLVGGGGQVGEEGTNSFLSRQHFLRHDYTWNEKFYSIDARNTAIALHYEFLQRAFSNVLSSAYKQDGCLARWFN